MSASMGGQQARRPSADAQMRLAASWVALMLTYLLGDVLRLYSGDVTPGEIGGVATTEAMWLAVAIVMSTPIVMVVASVVLAARLVRWLHMAAAVGLFVFNLVGLPTYANAYDTYLIGLGLVLNAGTVAIALRWHRPGARVVRGTGEADAPEMA